MARICGMAPSILRHFSMRYTKMQGTAVDCNLSSTTRKGR